MPGKNIVSTSEPKQLPKKGENPEVELGTHGETASLKENSWGWCCLVQERTKLAMPERRTDTPKDWINYDSGYWICHMALRQASKEEAKHGLHVSRQHLCNVWSVA